MKNINERYTRNEVKCIIMELLKKIYDKNQLQVYIHSDDKGHKYVAQIWSDTKDHPTGMVLSRPKTGVTKSFPYNMNESKKYDFSNFYDQTIATFSKTKVPNRKPDYVSRDDNGKISSVYWDHGNGVTRFSDHWGIGIGDSHWRIKGSDWKPAVDDKPFWRAGFVKYDQIKDGTPFQKNFNSIMKNNIDFHEIMRSHVKSKLESRKIDKQDSINQRKSRKIIQNLINKQKRKLS